MLRTVAAGPKESERAQSGAVSRSFSSFRSASRSMVSSSKSAENPLGFICQPYSSCHLLPLIRQSDAYSSRISHSSDDSPERPERIYETTSSYLKLYAHTARAEHIILISAAEERSFREEMKNGIRQSSRNASIIPLYLSVLRIMTAKSRYLAPDWTLRAISHATKRASCSGVGHATALIPSSHESELAAL